MIYVFNVRRIIIPVLLLLFLGLTAIIILAVSGKKEAAIATAQSAGVCRVLIIDAGHGGADGGAIAADGTVESHINLQIAKKLETVARLFGVSTVMTRASEEIDYPPEAETIAKKKKWDQKHRAEIIAGCENAVLVSIHQNKYPHSSPVGSQVLYASSEGSKALGELAHANLIKCLMPENRRVASPISDSIYLLRDVKCPAILVECGFISNVGECEKLKSEEYQTKIAVVLLCSYAAYLAEAAAY